MLIFKKFIKVTNILLFWNFWRYYILIPPLFSTTGNCLLYLWAGNRSDDWVHTFRHPFPSAFIMYRVLIRWNGPLALSFIRYIWRPNVIRDMLRISLPFAFQSTLGAGIASTTHMIDAFSPKKQTEKIFWEINKKNICKNFRLFWGQSFGKVWNVFKVYKKEFLRQYHWK